MRYSDVVLDHFYNPRNVGVLSPSLATGLGILGTPGNGDIVEISIYIVNGKIMDAKFKAQASCATIAACSYLTECLRNTSLDEVHGISSQQLMEDLALPPTKLHCVILAIDAVSLAIADFNTKTKQS